MVCLRRFLGRLLLFTFVPTGVALAQDLPPPETPETPASSRVQQIAIDGSAVGTSLGERSVDLSATFAPFSDINDSGVRIRATGSVSWYRFITNQDPLTFGSGHTWEGGLLAGYQFSMPRVSFIGLIGPTYAESTNDGVRSTNWGAKTVLSMYALPSDQTMAYGSLTYSTVANFLMFQSKVGMKLVGNFYIGPEAIFSWRNVLPAFNNVASMRIGGHISTVSFGPVQIGVSGGWAHQQDLGSGYYGSVNFYVTF